MNLKEFKKITDEVLKNYGFIFIEKTYVLELKDIVICVVHDSCRGVRALCYFISVNELHDSSEPIQDRYDTVIQHYIIHSPNEQGYHKHELKVEEWTIDEYKTILTNMLDETIVPYKEKGIEYFIEKAPTLQLNEKARRLFKIYPFDK